MKGGRNPLALSALVILVGLVGLAIWFGFLELGVLDYGARRWAIVALAAVGVSASLIVCAVSPDDRTRDVLAVCAFTGTGAALIVSA